MLQLSKAYSDELIVLEGIGGAIPGKPGEFSWYYDNIGVATLGNGHALVDTHGEHIERGEADASARADAAVAALGYGPTLDQGEIAALKAKDMASYAGPVASIVRSSTTQEQFDALVDFSYNVGVGALKSSTLLKMHNAGNTALGGQDLHQLAKDSQNKAAITTVGQAFAAWSNADHQWSKGVFHRRMWEFLIYCGIDYHQAYSTAWAFQG